MLWKGARGIASVLAFVASSRSGRTTVPSGLNQQRTIFRTAATTTTTTTLKATSTRYLLHYDYVPDVLEKRPPYRDEHLRLAKELCRSGGPTAPTTLGDNVIPTGALFIFDTLAAAQAFVEKDPYVVEAGIVTAHSIEEWTVAIEK